MLNVILIATHKQQKTAQQIVDVVLSTKSDKCRLVVVYESQQDDISSQTNNNLYYVVLAQHNFTGFSAGANRDLGIAFVEKNFPGENNYVFLDGDCIPSPDLIEHHAQVLGSNHPVVTCGSRKNATSQGILEDKRLLSPLIKPRVFSPGTDRLVFDVRDIRAHNVVWSCNLGINAQAIKNIRKANATISSSNRVFCDLFDGQWGGEDTLLGLAAFHTSTPIVCLDPNRSWVMHQEHEISYQGTSNLKKVFGYATSMQSRLETIEHVVVNTIQVFDTPEFYQSITHATQSAWMKRVCEYHKLSSEEERCVAYMFGANPDIEVKHSTEQSTFLDQARLAKLYSKLRNTPIGYKDVMV